MIFSTSPSAVPASIDDGPCCGRCGTFLDPPRTNPASGVTGRKCLTCLDWQMQMQAIPLEAIR